MIPKLPDTIQSNRRRNPWWCAARRERGGEPCAFRRPVEQEAATSSTTESLRFLVFLKKLHPKLKQKAIQKNLFFFGEVVFGFLFEDIQKIDRLLRHR